MAKILLIEDDKLLAESIRDSLQAARHSVDLLINGDEGLWWLQNNSYDVAIVDWNLPGLQGIDICKQYRSNGGSVPILMLTGKRELQDMVHGLDSGADDYISKPFKIEELHARLRSLLRRVPTVSSEVTRIDNVELNSRTGVITADGKLVECSRTEFAILELLMKNPGVLYPTESIMDKAWPTASETSPDTVRCHVTRIRKKLEEASRGSSRFIKTVWGCGYKAELSGSENVI